MFEDFQLADFGNRIPSLTFELFERETPVPLMDIASATSAGAITGQSAATLTGFAAQGSDCRAALEPLVAVLPVLIRPLGDKMTVSDWNAATPTNILTDPAISDGKSRISRPSRSREANSRAPSSLSIRHYEAERDFQTGVQTSRTMGNARTKTQIDLPAVLEASAARHLAELQILQQWRGLNVFTASLPVSATVIEAGNRLSETSGAQALRIVEVEHQRGTTRVIAREWGEGASVNPAADPGRSLPATDLTIGETRLLLADLPAFGTDDPGRAVLVAAAAGTGAGWRRAALSLMDGDRDVALGGTKGVATMGHLQAELPPHTAMLEDRMNQPVIRLLNAGMTLPTGSGDPKSFDAPLLWLGSEIIRYGNAEQIGAQDYRLSGLLRGCFGTQSNGVHAAQSDVFLIEPDSLLQLDSMPTPVDSSFLVEAQGIADAIPVQRHITVTGNAIRPPRPVHGMAERFENGGILLQWKRRDRLPHIWADGADVPDSEGTTEYAVELYVGGARIATWRCTASSLLLTAAETASLSIGSGAVLQFNIIQLGRFARSLPLVLTLI